MLLLYSQGEDKACWNEQRLVGDLVPRETVPIAPECFKMTESSITRALQIRKRKDCFWASGSYWDDIVEHMLCSRLLTGQFADILWSVGTPLSSLVLPLS